MRCWPNSIGCNGSTTKDCTRSQQRFLEIHPGSHLPPDFSFSASVMLPSGQNNIKIKLLTGKHDCNLWDSLPCDPHPSILSSLSSFPSFPHGLSLPPSIPKAVKAGPRSGLWKNTRHCQCTSAQPTNHQYLILVLKKSPNNKATPAGSVNSRR